MVIERDTAIRSVHLDGIGIGCLQERAGVVRYEQGQPAPPTRSPIRKYGFNRFWTDEATRPKNKFRAALLIVFEINVIPLRHHAAFALTHDAHVDREIFLRYPEPFTSAKVGSDLCTMNDILAR